MCGLIDAIYARTRRLFLKQFYFYVLTFLLPFIIHIFFEDNTVSLYLLFVGAGSLGIFMLYELVQMSHDGFCAYIDFYNAIDLFICPVHGLNIWLHMNNTIPVGHVFEEGEAPLTEEQLNFKVARVYVLILELFMALIKLQYYMRVFPEYGKLVQLVTRVLHDI